MEDVILKIKKVIESVSENDHCLSPRTSSVTTDSTSDLSYKDLSPLIPSELPL